MYLFVQITSPAVGFLFDYQQQYTEIAEKEKVGSTKKKQRRGKVLKPTKRNSTNPSFCCS
jgi:hypothetical protein